MKSDEERRKKDREYYWKTRSRRLELNKKRYKENQRAFFINNKRAVLKKKYKLSLEDYNEMFERQGGKCALCLGNEEGKLLNVDHDHKTGKVRALLCGNCNRGLGLFKDDKELLDKASKYLKMYGG